MFAAYVQISWKLVTDSYGDKAKKIAFALGSKVPDSVPPPVAKAVEEVNTSPLAFAAASIIVSIDDKPHKLEIKVVTSSADSD